MNENQRPPLPPSSFASFLLPLLILHSIHTGCTGRIGEPPLEAESSSSGDGGAAAVSVSSSSDSSASTTTGSGGDGGMIEQLDMTPMPATGVTIERIHINQGVARPIAESDEEQAPSTPVVAFRPGLLRVFYATDPKSPLASPPSLRLATATP